jgi:hypothetical protein
MVMNRRSLNWTCSRRSSSSKCDLWHSPDNERAYSAAQPSLGLIIGNRCVDARLILQILRRRRRVVLCQRNRLHGSKQRL